jgi:hypothetical protein
MTAREEYVLTIVYDEYVRFGGGEIKVRTFRGATEFDVLVKVACAHSYLDKNDDTGVIASKSVDEIVAFINERNGDGCDYIAAAFEGEMPPRYSKLTGQEHQPQNVEPLTEPAPYGL